MNTPDVVRVEARATRAPVAFEGVLRPSEEQEVRTVLSVAAFHFVLESYAVARGDRVRRGDLLARFGSPHASIREAHERSMMQLLEAQLADARRAALKSRDAEGELGVTAAMHRLEQSRAMLEAHCAMVAGVDVRSPIDGVVAELPPVPASASQPVAVARVVRTDPLRLEVPLPLGDRVPPRGEPVEVAVGGARRAGVVRSLAPFADALGLVVLAIDVPNADAALPAMLRARGTIDVGARRGLFVPSSALAASPAGHTVQVWGPRGVESRAVRVIATSNDRREAEVAGLVEGEPKRWRWGDRRVANPGASPPAGQACGPLRGAGGPPETVVVPAALSVSTGRRGERPSWSRRIPPPLGFASRLRSTSATSGRYPQHDRDHPVAIRPTSAPKGAACLTSRG